MSVALPASPPAAPSAVPDGLLAPDGWPLVIIGLCLLAGFVAHVIGQRAHVPRVTLLLLIGVVVGPSGLGVAPEGLVEWFPLAAQLALSMVGFELGERFVGRNVRSSGRTILVVAVAVTLFTALAVFVGLLIAGVSLVMALLLAGIASATDPAATVDVIRETRSGGTLTDTVLGVVAVDDAIGVMLFSVLVVIARVVGDGSLEAGIAGLALWEVGGGVLVGLVFGVPMALLTGRIRAGEPTRLETLGFVLCASGVASLLGVSYLITAMVQGAVVANFARHHTRPFHVIENVTQPFLVVFFILAGFRLDTTALVEAGTVAVAYLVARSIGRVVGGTLGARLARADRTVGRHVGWCLLPQAGVALGLGLLAADEFPEFGDRIVTLLIGTTVVFEILGPLATRIVLRMSGESRAASIGGPSQSES
ncbi:MAG: cation:proton antiporter [Planctomycetes bacterium]|nr:cation:proton antiporter [Planctomycetota bacterium]